MIWDIVQEAWRRVRRPAQPPLDLPGVEFHDRRAYAMQAHGPERKWKVRQRPMSKVTGQCWHQAGCDLGEQVERYDSVGAHACVTRGRKVIWLHDWTHLGMFANGWNDATVSIEVSGLYAGIEGDLSTVWDNPATTKREAPVTLTPELAATCRDVVRWIRDDANRRGANVRVLVTHRQASASRRSDPGQGICRDVLVPVAAETGLEFASDAVLGDGKPCPEQWDPRQHGVRY